MSAPRPDAAERPDLPEGPRTVFSRFVMPADDWARDDADLGPRTVDVLMLTLLAALAVAAGAAVAWYRGAAGAGVALVVTLVVLGLAAGLAFVAMRKVRRDLHAPLARLYTWALGMCTGDFSTRVPPGEEGAYRKLAFHINRLSEALEGLANEMDDVVGRQTERLREQNASLELSKTLSIVRERAAIAHELHDSLAQTLASLRLQVDMLADSLSGAEPAPPELARIQATLESANIELRELIASFRAPVDGRDLRTALEELIARYTAQSAMTVHLQIDGELPELPAGPQLQVVRIVGEALANACTHSGADLVRVLVRSDAASMRVLVEDDGRGFCMTARDAAPGEHIGLSVMCERARWLDGSLDIESEPGEGTRVSLAFPKSGAGAAARAHAP
ncbi:MAG: histidine kinase [Thiotrichales bacterium]|nr:histidine kinase [Thiotrichales bacterium]